MRSTTLPLVATLALIALLTALAAQQPAQAEPANAANENDAADAAEATARAKRKAKLEAARRKLAKGRYDLRYKFQAGETVRWNVTHLATVETTIGGYTQVAKSRSASTKAWKITAAPAQGPFSFVHQVERVNMWQKVSKQEAVHYDSKFDKKPPKQYAEVAATVGKPLARVEMDHRGRVLKRVNARANVDIGVGELAVPLPPEAVPVGHRWSRPDEFTANLKGGRQKTIKLSHRYQLTKVEGDTAVISAKTIVLTPVDDPVIEVQLVQRLSSGVIHFDMKQGRVVWQQMDLSRKVIGFEGPDSIVHYLSRFTVEHAPAAATAAKPAGATR